MDLLDFVADHFGHFSPYDIPNLLFAVLVASTLGYVLGRWGGGKDGPDLRALALWAGTSALAVGFVRTQLPLAVVLLAFVILVKGNEAPRQDRVLLFGSLVFGLGCGSGASLVTIALAVPFVLVVRWAFGGAGKA